MASMKDVAEMAGVSVSTVSLVLNNKKTVSKATQDRIMASVEALGYRPNMVARGFKTKRTKAIAVLVPMITNPVYPSFVHNIETAARREGYQVILYSYDDDSMGTANMDFLSDLYDRMVDGIIVCGIPQFPSKRNARKTEETLKAFIERNTPFVFFSEEEQLNHFATICKIDPSANPSLFHLLSIDREKATYGAIKHLLQTGHKRIAFVAEGSGLAFPHNVPYMKKLAGYTRALQDSGIAFDPSIVVSGMDDYSGGDECYMKLSEGENPPTAYFCTGDIIALGVLHAAHRCGCNVPEQVSVIGFDNIPVSSYWNPKLSTVAVPTGQIAKEAFKRLNWVLNGVDVPSNRHIFDTELIIRESSR